MSLRRKLINQGMITGTSAFVYRWNQKYIDKRIFISKGLIDKAVEAEGFLTDYSKDLDLLLENLKFASGGRRIAQTLWKHFDSLHADVSLVNSSNELDTEGFKNWQPEYKDAIFILENGEIYDANTSPEGRPGGATSGGAFIVSREVEKMSKSKYNVVNPDDIVTEYGADSLRLYEMF